MKEVSITRQQAMTILEGENNEYTSTFISKHISIGGKLVEVRFRLAPQFAKEMLFLSLDYEDYAMLRGYCADGSDVNELLQKYSIISYEDG